MDTSTEQPSNLPRSSSETPPNSESPPDRSTDDQAPEDKPIPRGLVERGEWNVCIGVLGRRGTGKSQYATARMLEYARQPCYAVAHDIPRRLPKKLHTGKQTGIVWHASQGEAAQAMKADPKHIHAIATQDAGPVVALARSTAQASLDAHSTEEVEQGHPCMVLLDEIVLAGICRPNYLSPEAQELITQCRHWNCGVIWTCQSARMVHNQLIGLASELVLFKLTDERDHKRLIEAGVDEEIVMRTRDLPNYKYLRVSLQ